MKKSLFILALVGFISTAEAIQFPFLSMLLSSKKIKDFGSYRAYGNSTYAKSCYDYKFESNSNKYIGDIGDGVYRIKPDANPPIDVYCDMTTQGGGWTLIANASATNSNHYGTSTVTNPSSGTYMVPYESVQAGRKLADNTVKAIASEKIFKIEIARNQAHSGVDYKYSVFYKMADFNQFSFANTGGTTSFKIFVSYSYPYSWEEDGGGDGYNFGCSSQYYVFDGHGSFGTSCSNGTSGTLWLSSGYASVRVLYGYLGSPNGIYGGTSSFTGGGGNPGYVWVR